MLSEQKGYNFISYIHKRFCDWRLAIFLGLCLCLGGTSLNVMALKIPLYYISVCFIGHALLFKGAHFNNLLCPTVIIGVILIGIFCLYLIPLPPTLWTLLSGRELVVESFEYTQNTLPWLPVSLVPHATFESLFNFLPIIAIAIIMKLSASNKEIKLAELSIIGFALLSIFIGLVQVISEAQIVVVYDTFSRGYPIGFFSNINHQATLLATALPLSIYYVFNSHSFGHNKKKILFVYGLSSAVMILVGLILSGSTAGYLFLIINLSVAIFIMSRTKRLPLIFLIPIFIILTVLLLDFILLEGHLGALLTISMSEANTSRKIMLITSIDAAQYFGALGIGPGAFEEAYRIFEDQNKISTIYVNEAHNEYVQMWMELGYLGILWIFSAAFYFMYKISTLVKLGLEKRPHDFIYCLCILTLLLHSTVDYPLRTIAMSAIFAFLIIRLDSPTET